MSICASSCPLSNASSSPERGASYQLASARHACASCPSSRRPSACRRASCHRGTRPKRTIPGAPRWLASAALLLSSNPKLVSLGPRYVLSFCAADIGPSAQPSRNLLVKRLAGYMATLSGVTAEAAVRQCSPIMPIIATASPFPSPRHNPSVRHFDNCLRLHSVRCS